MVECRLEPTPRTGKATSLRTLEAAAAGARRDLGPTITPSLRMVSLSLPVTTASNLSSGPYPRSTILRFDADPDRDFDAEPGAPGLYTSFGGGFGTRDDRRSSGSDSDDESDIKDSFSSASSPPWPPSSSDPEAESGTASCSSTSSSKPLESSSGLGSPIVRTSMKIGLRMERCVGRWCERFDSRVEN